jgi:hypothetical protein
MAGLDAQHAATVARMTAAHDERLRGLPVPERRHRQMEMQAGAKSLTSA